MGRVTRGTLLATLKELKKHPRPKSSSTAAVAVQAICPQKVAKIDRNAELKASIERRRALMSEHNRKPIDMSAFMEAFDKELWDYCKVLKERRDNSNKESLFTVDSAE